MNIDFQRRTVIRLFNRFKNGKKCNKCESVNTRTKFKKCTIVYNFFEAPLFQFFATGKTR